MSTEELRRFWAETRAALDATPLNAAVEPWEPLSDRRVAVSRVTLTSYQSVRIRGWYLVPSGTPPSHGWPALLTAPGYSEAFSPPHYLVAYGYAVFFLFPRGQGESKAEWQLDQGTKLTSHITERDHYYYRGAYMDCVRGLDFLSTRPEIDTTRLGMFGTSQGGGFTLATAALDQRVRAAAAWVPFLCNFPVAAGLTTSPYGELNAYLAEHPAERETALATLAWYDTLDLVDAITVPTLVSIGGQDIVCPEATVMPVFERIRSRKTLLYLPEMEHGGGVEAAVETKAWFDHYLR